MNCEISPLFFRQPNSFLNDVYSTILSVPIQPHVTQHCLLFSVPLHLISPPDCMSRESEALQFLVIS